MLLRRVSRTLLCFRGVRPRATTGFHYEERDAHEMSFRPRPIRGDGSSRGSDDYHGGVKHRAVEVDKQNALEHETAAEAVVRAEEQALVAGTKLRERTAMDNAVGDEGASKASITTYESWAEVGPRLVLPLARRERVKVDEDVFVSLRGVSLLKYPEALDILVMTPNPVWIFVIADWESAEARREMALALVKKWVTEPMRRDLGIVGAFAWWCFERSVLTINDFEFIFLDNSLPRNEERVGGLTEFRVRAFDRVAGLLRDGWCAAKARPVLMMQTAIMHASEAKRTPMYTSTVQFWICEQLLSTIELGGVPETESLFFRVRHWLALLLEKNVGAENETLRRRLLGALKSMAGRHYLLEGADTNVLTARFILGDEGLIPVLKHLARVRRLTQAVVSLIKDGEKLPYNATLFEREVCPRLVSLTSHGAELMLCAVRLISSSASLDPHINRHAAALARAVVRSEKEEPDLLFKLGLVRRIGELLAIDLVDADEILVLLVDALVALRNRTVEHNDEDTREWLNNRIIRKCQLGRRLDLLPGILGMSCEEVFYDASLKQRAVLSDLVAFARRFDLNLDVGRVPRRLFLGREGVPKQQAGLGAGVIFLPDSKARQREHALVDAVMSRDVDLILRLYLECVAHGGVNVPAVRYEAEVALARSELVREVLEVLDETGLRRFSRLLPGANAAFQVYRFVRERGPKLDPEVMAALAVAFARSCHHNGDLAVAAVYCLKLALLADAPSLDVAVSKMTNALSFRRDLTRIANLFIWFELPERSLEHVAQRAEGPAPSGATRWSLSSVRSLHAALDARLRSEAVAEGSEGFELLIEANVNGVWFAAASTDATIEKYLLTHGQVNEEPAQHGDFVPEPIAEAAVRRHQ
jgi:hypothetical protein